MLVAFISHRPWSDLSEKYRELIQSISQLGPTVLLSPEADNRSPINAPLTISLDRPLELQVDIASLTEESMVLVALHPSVEPVTHSRAFPMAWIMYEKQLTSVEPAVSLATRAGLVVAPERVRSRLGVPDCKGLAEDSPAQTIRKRLTTLLPQSSLSAYDAALGAQVFHRTEEVRKILAGETGSEIPRFRKAKLATRYDQHVTVSIGEDDIAAALDSLQLISDGQSSDSAGEMGSVSKLPPFVTFLVELATAESRGEVLIPGDEARIDDPSYRRAWVAHLGRLGPILSSLQPDQAELVIGAISSPDDRGALTPGLVAALPALFDRAGKSVADAHLMLRQSADMGSGVTSMAAELMLIRAGIDEGEAGLGSRIDDLLLRVDDHATYTGLWVSATSYWRKMTGGHWRGGSDRTPQLEKAEGVPDTSEGYGSLEATNQQAQEALAAEEFSTAAQLFRMVRAIALAETPVNRTQEMAARLNLGWTLWKDNQPEEDWQPLVVGVLKESGPNRALITLRALCAETADVIHSREFQQRVLASRLAADLDAVISADNARNIALPTIQALIDEIDALATHQDLWTSGLRYWRAMTGNHWVPSQSHPAPDLAPDAGVAEDISSLDHAARRALRNRRRKKAILLFEQVRIMSLQHDPPLVSTEQAARLNIGWALWKTGAATEGWAAYITSVLTETGPAPELVDIRKRAFSLIDEGNE